MAMSPLTPPHTKKRKLAEAPTSSKKSKRDKKAKEAKAEKSGKGKKDKGKSKAGESRSEFRVVNASLVVSISPVFAGNPRAGVEEMLDSMIMRYIPAFEGVVLAHSDLRFLDHTATIKADCPFSICKVAFDATIWRPHIGMKLVGQVNLCSPDHIALLVHRTFNVSIPRHHIPTDHWEFEYGAAENDPDFRPVGAKNDEGEHGDPEAEDGAPAKGEEEEGGKWIHSITGEKLGGPDGFLEFTVIGFTIANEMLSLRGSLQPDPFSPTHVPEVAIRGVSEVPSESSTAVVRSAILAFEEEEDLPFDEYDGIESGEDTFARLGRLGDDARAAREREREAEVALEQEKKKEKKKRKRLEAEAEGDVEAKNSKTKGKKLEHGSA